MPEPERITPIIHVGYMIQEILMQKEKWKHQWWVVWYNTKTMASAAMESFPSIEDAIQWNEENPPETIDQQKYNRSTIIYSGD